MNRRQILKIIGASMSCGLSGLSGLVSAASTHSDLIATRFFPSPDYNRLTFEFNKKPIFNTLLLENPNRLVLDFSNVSDFNSGLVIDYDKYSHHDYNLIKKVRAAKFNESISRVVLDLNRKLISQPKVFMLDPVDIYKYRLVIDLYLNNLEQLYINNSLDDLILSLSNTEQKLNDPVLITNNVRQKRSKDIIVMLDPGHGGEDPGAIGRGGSYEKNITLDIAKKLHKKINSTKGLRAELTRDRDYFVPLHVRVAKARKAKADIFISIHADASTKSSPYGASAYVLSEGAATSVRARLIANKENAADLIGGVQSNISINGELGRLLAEMSTNAQIEHSKIIAAKILAEIGSYNKLHKSTVEGAGFAVLKAPNIPSVLVETGFISNPNEERLLNSNIHQDKIANSILNSLVKYTSTYNV